MNNLIQLKPISELLGLEFFIPAYQRGYRWTEIQVRDLLDDIYSFAIRKKTGKEFYCLQPIIVKEVKETGAYEVIDGQQRLTTLRILFSYLIEKEIKGTFEEDYDKPLYSIEYETHPKGSSNDSSAFLDDIKDDKDNNIDFYHISQAHKYIVKWFSEQTKQKKVRGRILDTLVNDREDRNENGIVEVIWYELADENINPIDVFIRINLGKISLTNAELIKALFLQERNFGEGDAAKLKQLEIAQKWDSIENELQEEKFWWFLNKKESTSSSHIEFLFDMIYEKERIDIEEEELVDDDYATFRYYAKRFGNEPNYNKIKLLWDSVEALFDTFKEWYQNPEWYHYIGFLVYCDIPIFDILKGLNTPEIITKQQVTNFLSEKIKPIFNNIKWVTDPEAISDLDKCQELHLDLNYSFDKGLLRRFYLLFNLEYINQQSKSGSLIYYFPFKDFKVGKGNKSELAWDIEHIDSATDNRLVKFEHQKEWLENAIVDIPNIPTGIVLEIRSFIDANKSDEKKFDHLEEEVMKLSKETHVNSSLKNSIGNLTLLDAGTNRGYGNALFTSKRRTIIEKDKSGTFIPVCTKNVFLKYFDGNVHSTWVEDDIKSYRTQLENVMSKFLPSKEAL